MHLGILYSLNTFGTIKKKKRMKNKLNIIASKKFFLKIKTKKVLLLAKAKINVIEHKAIKTG